MSKKHKIIIISVIITLLLTIHGVWQWQKPKPEKISYNQFLEEVEKGVSKRYS